MANMATTKINISTTTAGITTQVTDRRVVALERRSRTVPRGVNLDLRVEATVHHAARDLIHEDMTSPDNATRAWRQIRAAAAEIDLRRGTSL